MYHMEDSRHLNNGQYVVHCRVHVDTRLYAVHAVHIVHAVYIVYIVFVVFFVCIVYYMLSIVQKEYNKTKVIAAQRSLDEAHVNAEEQLDLNQAAVESEVPKLRQETSGPKRTRLDQNLPLRNFCEGSRALIRHSFLLLMRPLLLNPRSPLPPVERSAKKPTRLSRWRRKQSV